MSVLVLRRESDNELHPAIQFMVSQKEATVVTFTEADDATQPLVDYIVEYFGDYYVRVKK